MQSNNAIHPVISIPIGDLRYGLSQWQYEAGSNSPNQSLTLVIQPKQTQSDQPPADSPSIPIQMEALQIDFLGSNNRPLIDPTQFVNLSVQTSTSSFTWHDPNKQTLARKGVLRVSKVDEPVSISQNQPLIITISNMSVNTQPGATSFTVTQWISKQSQPDKGKLFFSILAPSVEGSVNTFYAATTEAQIAKCITLDTSIRLYWSINDPTIKMNLWQLTGSNEQLRAVQINALEGCYPALSEPPLKLSQESLFTLSCSHYPDITQNYLLKVVGIQNFQVPAEIAVGQEAKLMWQTVGFSRLTLLTYDDEDKPSQIIADVSGRAFFSLNSPYCRYYQIRGEYLDSAMSVKIINSPKHPLAVFRWNTDKSQKQYLLAGKIMTADPWPQRKLALSKTSETKTQELKLSPTTVGSLLPKIGLFPSLPGDTPAEAVTEFHLVAKTSTETVNAKKETMPVDKHTSPKA